MSSNRRIRRDDFDIESIETFRDRDNYKSRSSGSRTRSRSRKRSYSKRHDDSRSRSRSRSHSLEHRHQHRGRDSYSRSRSRSRSRGYSRRSERHNHQVSRRYGDSRSRSYSRSRSRSLSYTSRHHSDRDRDRDHHRYRHDRRISRSRSRSRSSSHFREFGGTETTKSLAHLPKESYDSNDTHDNLEDLPLPQQKLSSKQHTQSIYQFDDDEPIDRARIHREMEEKLRAELAKEGKVYPPPKPEPSHPVFANDGSFLEIFKKMQQAQTPTTSTSAVANVSNTDSKPLTPSVPQILAKANPTTAPYLAASASGKSAPPPPIVGRRRGGKILKTGVVAKPKVQADANADPKDFWSLYLAEVNKYKNTACESEQGNRPLVK